MNFKKVLLAGLFGVAALSLALVSGTKISAESAAPVRNDIFHGKIVTAYLADPLKGTGQVLKDARLERIGDRWILLGTGVSTGQAGEWDEGLTAGVSWDDVTAFYIFTPEQFDEKMKDAGS